MSKRRASSPTGGAPDPEGTVAATWEPLSKLTPWADNPRRNVDAVAPVADAIVRFGFTSPILARRATGEIIAGHTRFLAAQRLGLATVPVRWLDVDAATAHAICLADNKLGEVATWDEAMLAGVLADLRAHDAPLVDAGFTDAEVEELVAKAEAAAATAGASDQSAEVRGQFLVVVECRDEAHQVEVLEALTEQGLACRALVS